MDKKVKVTTEFNQKVTKLEGDLFIGIIATKSEDAKGMSVTATLLGGNCSSSEIAQIISESVISIIAKIEKPSIIQSFMLSEVIEALEKANDETRSKIPGEIIKDFKSGK